MISVTIKRNQEEYEEYVLFGSAEGGQVQGDWVDSADGNADPAVARALTALIEAEMRDSAWGEAKD